jgi:hypothetical protein
MTAEPHDGQTATPAGDTVTRPDGRTYRSRKIAAYAVVDGDEFLCGVMVLGTHDVQRARELADSYASWQLGSEYAAADPVTGWWYLGYAATGRAWIEDPVKGRAGVWFRQIAENAEAIASGAAS